tara:strand:- start:7056 stop:8582 length:1527 start_codon:yes stop_codon:yes gene_type:complete
MAVVYKKSALNTFFEQLPSLIMGYQKQKADREYDTQMYFLRNEMDKQRELEREQRKVIQQSSELGITKDLLDGMEGADSTVGYNDLINASANTLGTLSKQIENENDATEDNIDQIYRNISYFNVGKNLMQEFNIGDPEVDDNEMASVVAKATEKIGLPEGSDALENALLFIGHGATSSDPNFYQRQAAQRELRTVEEKALEKEDVRKSLYAERAEASGYPTIRNTEGLTRDEKYRAFEESSSITSEYTRISSFELDEIAEIGATQGGAGYDDQLPGQFDYSDMPAFEVGLRIKGKEYLENKYGGEGALGVKGYDESSIDNYVNLAMQALKSGGNVLTSEGLKEAYNPNVAFSKYQTPYEVSVLSSDVAKKIYTNPQVVQVLGQKDKLATSLKSIIFNTDGNIKEENEWSEIKKEARKVGFDKKSYERAVLTLSGIDSTNILEKMYLEKEDIRKLLQLTTGDTAKKMLITLNKYEKEIQNKLIQEERTMKPYDDEDNIDFDDPVRLFGK